MNLNRYLQTWQGARQENRWGRVIILLLVVSNVIAWLPEDKAALTPRPSLVKR